MERVAIPVFESRVSPVLDSCNRMVVVEIENGREIRRHLISVEKMSLQQRLELFALCRIRKIICAGVSDGMCRLLKGSGIALVSGIAGELEKIITACICDRLDDPCFAMPGRKPDRPA